MVSELIFHLSFPTKVQDLLPEGTLFFFIEDTRSVEFCDIFLEKVFKKIFYITCRTV